MIAPAVPFVLALGAFTPEQRVALVVERKHADACPDDDTLRARVKERLGGDPFVDASVEGGARSVLVELKGHKRSLAATVTSFDVEGHEHGTRALTGPKDCAQLFDQLVLALAIAIDPLVLLGGTREPPVDLPEHSGGEGFTFSAPPPPAPAQPSPNARATSASVVQSGASALTAKDDVAADLPGHLVARGVIGTAFSEATLPTLAGAMELSFDIAPFGVDLGLIGALPAQPVADVAAQRSLLGVSLAPCARASWTPFTMSGCGLAEVGVLAPLRDAPGDPLLWVAPGVRAAFDVALSERLGVRVVADGLIPLGRRRIVEDGTGRWSAPLVAGQLALALEVQIW